MLRRNKNIKLGNSARIIKGEKKKDFLKRDKLDKLAAQIDSMPYGEKREEAKMALECLLSGKKVVLQTNGKICLYFERAGSCRMEESYAIEKNQELYTLLELLVSLLSLLLSKTRYIIYFLSTFRGDQQIIDCYQILIKNLVYSLLCSREL